jgi:hypothetical protein
MMTSFQYVACHLDAVSANRNHNILCGAGQEMIPLKASRTLEEMVAKRTPGVREHFSEAQVGSSA